MGIMNANISIRAATPTAATADRPKPATILMTIAADTGVRTELTIADDPICKILYQDAIIRRRE